MSSGSRLPSTCMCNSHLGSLSMKPVRSLMPQPPDRSPSMRKALLPPDTTTGPRQHIPSPLSAAMLLRQRSFDALGQPVHAEDIVVPELRTIGDLDLAALVLDGAFDDHDG